MDSETQKEKIKLKAEPVAYDYKGFSENPDYVKDNLAYRQTVIEKSQDDVGFQAMLMSMSKESILFWVNTFAWTFNPRLENAHLPFITFPFQDEYVLLVKQCVEEGTDLFTDKSRDMGVTWMVLATFLWGWLFHNWELRIGSRTRDYVDKGGDMNSLFEKLRYMMERLPDWMVPEGYENKRGTRFNTLCKLINPETRNALVGEATSPNFARGGRSKAIFYDEFAFWMCADEAWRGGADTTNCRIAVSTPYGKGNKFADLKSGQEKGIVKRSLHWSLHPLKTNEWYRDECNRRTASEIAQELDISYDTSIEGRVYEHFDKVIIGEGPEFDYRGDLPLYVTWDFGNGGGDPTAILWMQLDTRDGLLYIIDEYARAYMDINYFGTLINGETDSNFIYDGEALYGMDRRRNWKHGVHIGDPYSGRQTTFVGNTTIEKELRKHNIIMNLNRGSNSVMERIRLGTLWLPRLRVNSRCKEFIDAMFNSRYPRKERMQDKVNAVTKPVHDKFSNYRTSYEYGIEYLEGYRTAKGRNRFYPKTKIKSGFKDNYRNILYAGYESGSNIHRTHSL